MQFPLADFVSKTVACEKITVNYRHNELDALFAGLRTNKTVKKLKVAMVMNRCRIHQANPLRPSTR